MPPASRPPPASAPTGALRVTFDGFVLDKADAQLSQDGRAIALPPKALAVLCTLVRHAGRLVSKDALLDTVWGHRHVTESVLKSTISQVRAALGDDVRQPRYIVTASGHGYRFIAALASPDGAEGAPTGPHAASAGASTVIGRDAAWRRLDQAWSEVRQSPRRVLWISGEAGIGKTTLLESWLARCGATVVARGQCIEPFGAGEPYLPLLDALAHLCRTDPRWAEWLRQYAPAWLLQLPWLQQPGEAAGLRASLAGASQDRMLRELCELLEHGAREEPLLLVLEDLHWSDVSTVRAIDYLARRRLMAPLLVLGSFRSAQLVATDHPLKHLRHELRVQGMADEIALEPLSERDVAELLQRVWREASSDRLARALHARTDGLPVFLVNVIDDLRGRRGADPMDVEACMQALVLRVPETLAGIIGKQFAQLPGIQQAVLQAASVRGPSFSQHCVAAALDAEADAIRGALSALVRSGQWIEETGVERAADGLVIASYRFRHALYQQTIYGQYGAVDRVEAHLRIARHLAVRLHAGAPVAAAELALHFERGQEPAEALHWQCEAAANALSHLAPQEAADLATRGLHWLDRLSASAALAPLELSLRVTRGVASAQRHGVGSAAALADLERARALSEGLPHSPQHTWLANGLGWTYFSRGDLTTATAHAQAMADRASATNDLQLALCAANLLGACHAYSGHLDTALQWIDRGLELLDACGDDVATVRSIVDLETSLRVYRAQALAHRGEEVMAQAEAEAAVQRARQLGQPMSLCLALRCRCLLAIRRDDQTAVGDASQALLDLVDRHGAMQSLGPSRWYRGWSLARRGETAAGLAMIREGIAAHLALGMATGCALAHGYAAQVCLWSNDVHGARRHLDEGLSLAAAGGESLDQATLQRLLAEVERFVGNLAAAKAATERARACADAIGAA